MRAKWVGSVLVAVAAMWPSAASACDLFGAYGPGYAGGQTGLALGGAILVEPGDEDTYLIPSVGLGIYLGERLVVAPLLGFCTGGEDSELVLGGLAGVNLISTEQWSLGVQTHVARTGYEGYSEMLIPVLAAATFDVSETARLYANAGLLFWRYSPETGDSQSESDPAAAAGITLPLGSATVSGGITLVNGEDETDFGFGGRVIFPLG
jgi:hypothetical protein